MKKFKKGLLVAIASLSICAMGGCNKKDKQKNDEQQQQQSQTDDTVAVSSVSLDKETLDLFVTGSAYLRATVLPENATNKYLTWSSSNEDIAIVSATGKVTGLAAGQADITVVSQADPTKNATCHVTVSVRDDTVHVESVTLDRESADMYVGDNLQLTATVLPDNATNKGVTFSSDNKNVAFVDASGSVVAVNDGDAVIKATSNENPEKFDTCTVHVTTRDDTVHVTGLSVTPTEVNLDLGGTTTAQPTVTVEPNNATNKAVTWTSSDPSKVVVDGQGNIVAVAVTTTPVTVTVASVDNPALSRTISVTVVDTRDHSIHVDSVSLPENLAIDLKNSSTATLTATVLPSNAGNKLVNWVSSDPTVVTIGASVGETSVTLNALKTGTSTITATTEDGGLTDTCLVTVTDSKVYVESVIIQQNSSVISNLDITLGSYAQVVASVLPDNADNQGIVWEMEDGAENYIRFSATTGSNLTIFGDAATPEATSYVVTAKSAENGAIKATINVTVTDPTIYAQSVGIEVEGLVGNQTAATVENTRSIKLSAKVLPVDTTNPEIEWIVPTNNKIITTENLDHSLTVLGKDITDSPVVITARVKAQPTISADIAISVIDPTSVDRFVSFVDPADYIKFKGHIASQNLEDPDEVLSRETFSSNFYEYDDPSEYVYKVGDQGAFHFAPTAMVKLAGATESTPVASVASSKKLILIDGANETDVTSSMDTYCTIDGNGTDYHFTSEALGKTFRLELLPNDPNYYASKTIDSYDFTFEVIHGYNVDSLAELSLFDNTQSAWSTYKNIYGLTSPAEGGIVLHKDITITADIIPSQFLMTEDDFNALNGADFATWANTHFPGDTNADKQANAKNAFIGSPRDHTTIFKRSTKNEDFSFIGNFFQVDFSALKPVYLIASDAGTLMGGLDGDGSHAQFFGINTSLTDITVQHSVTMSNFALKGNGGLEYKQGTTELDALRKGGLIAFKMSNASFNIQNAIVSNSFISFMSEGYTTDRTAAGQEIMEMNADRVTVYNAYSNMFYLFGAPDNHVTNSWMSKSGGPLVLMDEPFNTSNLWYRDNDTIRVSMDCTNCYLKNEVMGTEPWFQGHAGSGQVITEQVVNPGLPGANWYYGAAATSGETGARTISRKVDDETKYCDLIAIDVRASSFADNKTYNMRGSFTVNNGEGATAGINMAYVARDGEGYFPLIPKAANEYGNMAPYIFSSNAGSLGVLGTSGLEKYSSVDLFNNKYTAAYMNPMYDSADLTNSDNWEGRFIGVFLGTYAI